MTYYYCYPQLPFLSCCWWIWHAITNKMICAVRLTSNNDGSMDTNRSTHSLHQATHHHKTLQQNLVARPRNHTSHHAHVTQLKRLETRLEQATRACHDWPGTRTQDVVDLIERQIRQLSCASPTNTL